MSEKQKKPPKKDSKLQETIDELTAALQRTQADFANYKRRSEQERAQSIEFGVKQTVMALLPTIDNIQRALTHVPKELRENEWAQGVAKVAQQLAKDLEKIGITIVGVEEEEFNPEFHEAVSVEGEGDIEVVSEVLQTGYALNGVVIRHAMVKVVKK